MGNQRKVTMEAYCICANGRAMRRKPESTKWGGNSVTGVLRGRVTKERP